MERLTDDSRRISWSIVASIAPTHPEEEATMATYAGGCHCGKIRYETSAAPIVTGHCQCTDCQRFSGTGHTSVLVFPAAAVKVTGAPKYYSSKADSGATISRGFCPDCGTPVVSKTTGMPDAVIIKAGSLDDPKLFEPQVVLFTKSAQPWDKMDEKLPAFPGMPPAV
jgi:hypothetical protein